MAAITSFATGNWNAVGTWGTGTGPVPGNGDTVTIANTHVITVNVNTTVGASLPSTSTAAIIVTGTTGKLIIATGVTLTCRGDIRVNDGFFQMNAGSTFKFDASAASAPASQHYLMYWNGYNGSIHFDGTAGSPCTVTSDPGGGSGAMTAEGFQYSMITATYTNFSNLGSASTGCMERGHGNFDLSHCVFDGCGALISLNMDDGSRIFRLVNVTTKNTLNAIYSWDGMYASVAITTGTRLIQACVFDKMFSSNFRDFTITDTIFVGSNAGPLSTAGFTPWTSFSGNLLEAKVSSADTLFNGDYVDSYYIHNHLNTNPHFLQPQITCTIRGSIFEYAGTDANGDCVMVGSPSAAMTVTVEHCIGLPNGGGNNSGTMFSLLGNANTTLIARHNTWLAGLQACGVVGETYAGHAGLLAQFRDNLCWDTTATAYKLTRDIATVTDIVTAANAHHNAGYNLLPGSNLKGYHNLAFSSGSPGANDVDGVNPNFVDAARDLAAWDASLGGPGTIAHALTELKKKNEAGYNAAYTIAAFVTWVKAGFVPRAAALQAASDSVAPSNGWIGAVQGAAVATITSAAAGNWNVGATWIGGVVPANGATAILNHVITVTANQTVGTSPVAGTDVVTVNATGGLVLSPGVTLTCRGDLKVTNATVTGGAGSAVKFDPSASAAPATTQYRLALEGTAGAAALGLLGIG